MIDTTALHYILQSGGQGQLHLDDHGGVHRELVQAFNVFLYVESCE